MTIPNNIMEQLRGTFRAEVLDLLIELDSALLALEAEASDPTLVHRVFRAIHTIKGSGATAGFAHLARFAHKMEEAFDLAREGRLAVTPELIDCGLRACDVIRLIIESKGPEDGDGTSVPGETEVTEALTRLLPAAPDASAERAAEPGKTAAIRAAFEIVLKPKREIFYSGADPVNLLDDLRELGHAHITAHVEQVPPLAALDPEQCYLWWEILLVTANNEAAIREVFVFTGDDCEVGIRLADDQAAAIALFGSVPAESLELFVIECEERLEDIERDALALEADPASAEALNSLFRNVHTIKGNAGVLLGQVKGASLIASHPLQMLMRVAHGLESLLDSRHEPVPEQTIQTALDTCDAIRTLLRNLPHHGARAEAMVSPALLGRLGVETVAAPAAPAARIADGKEAAFLNTTSQSVEMIAGCFRRLENAGDAPGPILQTWLRGLKMLSAAASYAQCPELEKPLARQLLILDAAVKTGTPPDIGERAELGSAFNETRSILKRLSAASPGVAESPAETSETADAPAKAPERPEAAVTSSTIRIDQNKLDRLMRIVGELLVARGAFPSLIQKVNDGVNGAGLLKDLKEAGSHVSRIADELQASVMSIRMLPVRTVFQKFPRLVRDLARSLGKEVQLVIEGEAIEMDKTILEQIGDPLVHVIRNAVDHGLEPPEERLASGKTAAGRLTLRAFHETGGVAIEVSEDGRGLDAAALKRKAVEKGLLTTEIAAGMTDEAAFQLVFLPGLSTAKKVTDVSGRGVGMDVVRSNVRNLQGTIDIRSKPGRGTTFLIKLPASLMISKGILLKAGGQEYILPLSNIRDMVKLPAAEVHSHCGSTIALVRGTIYSLFGLAEMMGLPASRNPAELSVAIVEAGPLRYGLVVDKFLTDVEVLIKPLTGGLEACRQFHGAAIMGDGRVVLVLNALECHSLGRTACA